MRVTKPRREFGLDNFQMIPKDAAESTTDLKVVQKGGQLGHVARKRVLDIGLQAANQIENL